MWPSQFAAVDYFQNSYGGGERGNSKGYRCGVLSMKFYIFLHYGKHSHAIYNHVDGCWNNSAYFLNYRHLNCICITCYRLLEMCDCVQRVSVAAIICGTILGITLILLIFLRTRILIAISVIKSASRYAL